MSIKYKKIQLVKIAIYRDGGTIEYITKEDYLKTKNMNIKNPQDVETFNNMQRYYLDNSFNSVTKGELIDRYPCKEAIILNKDDFEFLNKSDV